MPPETDGDLDPMFGNPRGSRVVKTILLAVVIALAAVTWLVWRSVRYHLGATALLEARGATVEWEVNGANWTKGGITRVSRKKRNMLPLRESDLAQLHHLHHPVELDLLDVPITDAAFAHLEGLESLEVLDIRGASVDPVSNPRLVNAALAHLRGLRRLKELTLAQRAVNDDGLANLAVLTGLRLLDVADSQVSDAGVRHLLGLVKLEDLNLRGTALTNEGLLQLAALPRLKTLNVQGTGVTAEGIFKLLRLRPGLDVYHDFNVEDIDRAFR